MGKASRAAGARIRARQAAARGMMIIDDPIPLVLVEATPAPRHLPPLRATETVILIDRETGKAAPLEVPSYLSLHDQRPITVERMCEAAEAIARTPWRRV